MRRCAVILLAVAVAACSKGETAKGSATGKPSNPTATTATDDHVRCAIAGAKVFEPVCTREVAKGPDGEIWIVHHPDGGFRRFVFIEQGTRIASADGAEEVHADRQNADLEVRVANDRYLFPAAPVAPSVPHALAS